MSTQDLLRHTTLFRRLSPDDRARIAAVSHLREYARGDRIFSEGDSSDFFVSIVTGRVKVFKATPAGKEIILEIFGPGDPTGITTRLVELTRRITELTGGRVEARFARLFLKLADQMGRPDRGGVFIPMPLSRQELADLTGTTIETCIRIMSRWGKDEVIRTARDGFVVVDRPTLESLAAT